jgi:hypothetical protein
VREQLRLKLVVPLVVIALGGLAVAKFVVLDDGSAEAEAAIPAATVVDTAGADSEPPAAASTTEEPGAEEPAAEEPPAEDAGVRKLDKALKKNKVVVVVVYSPDGAVDAQQVGEARAGAADVNVGFLSLNAAKEKEIGDFAQTYEIRTTPVVLVFRRGPELVGRFETFADSVTVAQAAQDARQAH